MTAIVTDGNGLPTDLSYQWFRNAVEIADANDRSYTLTNDDASKAITVTSTFTDNDGYEEAVTSADFDIEAIDVPADDLIGFLLLAYSTIGSSKYRNDLDVTKTTEPTWDEYFSKTLDIANIKYTHQDTSASVDSNAPYKVIDFFDINSVLRIFAYNGSAQNDVVQSSLEILDASDNVLAAVKVDRINQFRNELYYGTSLANLTKTGVTGQYPQTHGNLSFTASGMTYDNLSSTNFNHSFSFSVDLTNATKVRVFGYARATAIGGNGGAGAYIRVLP